MGFKVTAQEKEELLVTFAALILNDDKAPITADNISKLIKAAGGVVEPYWPKLFAQILEGQDVTKLLLSSGGGGGAAAPAAAEAAPAAGGKGGDKAAAGKDAGKGGKGKEKKEEPEEKEEEEDMGFSLFE